MQIAVTCRGKDLQADVDPRFGRARGFLVVDTETGSFEHLDNQQNLNAAQGAGIQSAQNVVNSGAELVITGHCGPKAFRVLSAAGVKVVLEAEGAVGQAIEKVKNGDLKPAESADVEGHWV